MDSPWMRNYYSAKGRCSNPKSTGYRRYGGRGIKFLLTKDEIKEMWFRDKAYLMKRASLDRIDNNGHYFKENCRFLETRDNALKDSHMHPVSQYDLNGNLIKVWRSVNDAVVNGGFLKGNLWKVLTGRRTKIKGYRFEYVNQKDFPTALDTPR